MRGPGFTCVDVFSLTLTHHAHTHTCMCMPQGFVAVVLSGSQMRVHFYTTEQSGPTYTRIIPQPAW